MRCSNNLSKALLLLAIVFLFAGATAQGADEGWIQLADPAAAGWDMEALAAAREYSESIKSGAVMVIHKGHVVVAWGDVTRPFRTHSVRKSLVSALYGIAVEEGLIDLETTIAELGIDDKQQLTEAEKQATLRNLIAARSGIYHPAAKETAGHEAGRPERGAHAPDTHWYYNNWDFNIAGLAYEMITGAGLYDAFERRIGSHIGMQDLRPVDFWYQPEPGTSNHPAWAFRMSARDRARFGQLVLQKGTWNGRQIVPAAWIEESTTSYSAIGEGRGYGYMWWLFDFQEESGIFSERVIAALGGRGQAIFIIPGIDMVFVHCDDSDWNMPVPGNQVWKLAGMIYDAMMPAPERDAVPLKRLEAEPYEHAQPWPRQYTAVELPMGVLMRYEGTYTVSGLGELTIQRYGDGLHGVLKGAGEAVFYPVSDTRFFAPEMNGFIDFHLDENQVATGGEMHIYMMGVETVFERAKE